MSGSRPSEESLAWTLPLPLARLWRRAANAKSGIERHQAAYYLWEAALKLLGSVAIVEYVSLGQRDPDVAGRLENLARPALGHWWEFVRRLLPILAEAPATGERFRCIRDLVIGGARADLPRAAGLDATLREALDGTSGSRTTVRLSDLFSRLVRHRNEELGHGAAGQRSRQFYERMGSAMFAGISEVLGRLDVLAGGRLLHIDDVRRKACQKWLIERYELCGESPRRLESIELEEEEVSRTKDLPRPGRVYIERPVGSQQMHPFAGLRSLHPLLLFDPDAGEVFFLNSRRGEDRARYLSYSTGQIVDRQDLGVDQREFFSAIAGEAVDPETMRHWAARSQGEEQGGSSAPAAGPTPETAPRRTLGEFQLLSKLGRGGMGVVYRAWQPSLGREVALKCVLGAGDPRIEARFAREIRSLGRVEHPNLVKVFTSGSDGDQWFYAMELIEGADLASVCDRLTGTSASDVSEAEWERAVSTACAEARRREEILTPSPNPRGKEQVPPAGPSRGPRVGLKPGRAHIEHSVDLVRQAAGAAHALHEAGVIHRDIKPGNIVVSEGGKSAILMDLGLAQLADDADGRLTRTRQFVGTLRYASPEQVLAAGNLDRRADIYSLGATLWELLTLRPLFGAGEETPTPELMLRIQSSEPERPRGLNPQVPPDLEAIVLKCLEKDRARRYETASGLAEDLARWQRGEPVEARALTLGYVFWKYAGRHRPQLAAGAALLGVLVAGIIAAFIHIDRARDVAEQERAKAVLARKETETALFDTYTSFGLEASDDGNPAQAFLWFANAAFLARDDAERQASNRVRLRCWSRKAAVPVKALAHPGGNVLEIAFHPGGTHLLMLASDNRATVWDLAAEEQLGWMGGDRPVSAAVFSPNGDRLAAGAPGGQVDVWSFPEGKKLWSVTHPGPVARIAFSRDGRRLAVASDRLRVWEVHGSEPVPITSELQHPKPIARIVFNSRSDRLATGCRDGRARVFAVPGDPSKAESLFPSVPHVRTTNLNQRSLEPIFIDDDRGLLTLSATSEVAWWDAETGAILRSIPFSGFVSAIVPSPDGRRFAVLWDNEAQLWDIAMRRPLGMPFVHPALALDAVFSPDSRRLLTAGADDATRVWLVPTRGRLAGSSERGAVPEALIPSTFGVRRVTCSPDGRSVATVEHRGLVRIFLLPEGRPEGWRVPLGANHTFVSTTGDGRYLILTGATYAGVFYSRHTTRVHETATGRAVGPVLRPGGSLLGAAFAPDGEQAMFLTVPRAWAVSEPGAVLFCDWRSGQTHELMKTPSWPMGLAYSPDGGTAVIVCWKGEIIAANPRSGEIRFRLEAEGQFRWPTPAGIIEGVRDVVRFSPDGRYFGTWGLGNVVQIWETATGKSRARLTHPDVCTETNFSADGSILLTVCRDNAVRVWDWARDVLAAPPLKHPTTINNACLGRGGDQVITACADNLARVWNWREGNLECPPLEHDAPVGAVAFLSGGRRAATVSGDGVVRTWELLTGRPLCPREPLLDDGSAIRQLVVGSDERWLAVGGESNILTSIWLGDLPEPTGPGMDAEDARTLGEVLSGQRVHGAALATLNSEEWIERWRSLRERRRGLLDLDLSPLETAGWHRRESQRLEERLHWDAAAWHAGRLRALGEPVDEGKLRNFDAFVRSWRFAKVSEPWLDPNSFVTMSDDKLRSIVASAATQGLVRSGGPLVDFLLCFEGRNADVAGYAVRSITSERDRRVRCWAGSDDALRIWLNGENVLQRPGYHAPVPDDESAILYLTAGQNTLVVEVSQGSWSWGLYLRFEDEDGRKLRLTDDGKLELLDEVPR